MMEDQPAQLSEYEMMYGTISGLHQLRYTIRAWKKIMVLIDPSLPYWSKRKEAEECRIVVKNESPYEFAVAEIEIPCGALIYCEKIGDLRYFRSSSAICTGITDGCGLAVNYGQSIYGMANCNTFPYEVGMRVFPSGSFDLSPTIYAPGIHFFESSEDAWSF